MTTTKTSTGRVEIKDVDKGQVEVVFSTLNVIDKDRDVTLPGAFDDGAKAAISAYGHSSWAGALPVGVATIRETRTEGIAEGQFFLDTADGADSFKTVKRLAEAGLGEWSYGFDLLEHSFGEFEGQKVRFLRRMKVHEVSPVLVGAGVNTRTLAAKAAAGDEGERQRAVTTTTIDTAIKAHETDVVSRFWDVKAVLAELGDGLGVSDLRCVAAWVDPAEDPESKDAYDFWHHHGPGGAANARAALMGIARLNAAGGDEPWQASKQSIYDHLAGHLRDADREPPELRPKGHGPLRFGDDVLSVMADVARVNDRAEDVLALRAPKGKQLSRTGLEYLDWLDDYVLDLHRKLRSFIESPDDEAAREYARFVRNSIGGHTP